MHDKKKGLGRGLDDLLPSTDWLQNEAVEVFYCAVDRLEPNPFQPRHTIARDDHFQELVASIRQSGVLQPILVTRPADGGPYQIVAGERRWQAAKAAGLSEVPVIVRETTQRDALELALVENIQRRDLNCIEEAQAYHRLKTQFGLTQEEIAQRVGKKRATVANLLRLVHLPRAIQEDVLNERLTMGHARALLALPSEEAQLRARDQVLQRNLSVRQTEALVQRMLAAPTRSRRPARPFRSLESALSRRFQTKVSVKRRGDKGTIAITFTGQEDLQRLLALLGIEPDGEPSEEGGS
ncbi:chromosome partitioning protein, ParB family [Desulfacinum hydrothermale DSM 13146]|uniref:Chromosome partitioning protein, ParB family n=1 Tax=Desulfacinum hydrothermale DSM 13146 TaxID=1121390 RepID=A0A1W1XJ84_9BACT|nr:ParB/RepB/Spo0J family partition protein [Desulfacinum hydrothermale]SMC23581.1 chromosome partitioning protein, ParB family [Desulfacinum hydrothermale DSM 13146]